MAYAMAAEASGHVAAISSVSGQVELPTIHPTRAVPTMEFHSVNDPIAKWVGVPNRNPRLRLSVMEGIDQWVEADGCDPTPHDGPTIVGAAGSISAGETATPVTYTDCAPASEVALWRFTGLRARLAGQRAQHRDRPARGSWPEWARGSSWSTRTRPCGSSSAGSRCPAPPPIPFIDTTLGFPGIHGSLLSGGEPTGRRSRAPSAARPGGLPHGAPASRETGAMAAVVHAHRGHHADGRWPAGWER